MTHARRTKGTLTALLAATAALLLAAMPAAAEPTIAKVFTGPIKSTTVCNPDATADATGAATRSDFCVAFRTNAGAVGEDDIKSQVVDTPAGYLGEPDRYPQCTDAQFNYASSSASSCPANTQMGDGRADIRTVALGLPVSLQPTGQVYNLEHGPDEVARLGIQLNPSVLGIAQPKVKILVRVILRPAPDVGLRSLIDNMPKVAQTTFGPEPLATDAFALRFWGSKDDHPTMPRSYGLLGSDCSNAQTGRVATQSYGGIASDVSSPSYELTDCAAVPFAPSAEYSVSDPRPDVPAETQVTVRLAEYNDPRTSATPKKTVNVLPEGLGLSAQIASGPGSLKLCTAEQFAHYEPQHSTCPAESKVGTVEFVSPLQTNPLVGEVFLGSQPAPGELPALFFEAETGTAVDAPRIKLVGSQQINDNNQIVATLDNLSQVPITMFRLTFRGGDHSAITTPPTCGSFKGSFEAYPYSAPGTPVRSEQTLTIDQDCDAVNAFNPAVSFVPDSKQAGLSTPMTVTLARPDRSPRMKQAIIDLPPGVLDDLRGVTECPVDVAQAGGCPASSRVGTLASVAGVGPAPYTQGGDIFLTAPQPGAVAGLAFSVPVEFGEVNLGTLNIVSRVDIRPNDLGLRVTSDIPDRFKGNPLNLRGMAIRIDRPGFARNPTNCGPLLGAALVTPDRGAAAGAYGALQVGGCDQLAFAPQLQAAVGGDTDAGKHPELQINITAPDGGSALQQTYITLPTGIGVDLKQISRACQPTEFVAGGCAASAVIGTVTGTLAITNEPLAGYLYLLKPAGGQILPGLGLAFEGRFHGRIVGASAIDTKTDRLVSQFPNLPDLPVTSLQLNIAGGNNGIVIGSEKLCGDNAVEFDGRFVGQNGATVTRTAETLCGAKLGESPKVSARFKQVRKGKPTLFLNVTAPDGKKLTEVKIGLPKSYRLDPKRARKSKYVAVKKLSVKGKIKRKKIRSRSEDKLRITLPSKGSTKARVITRTGLIKIKSRKVRRSKTKVPVSVALKYSDGTRVTVKMRLTPR